uniref:Metalloendopeptidase n=1 Tax=Pachycerianthus borealis TaxID=2736680 RepID=A0A7G7WYQ3_9CNID|nr:toxin candidate TRINITY_DN31071_c0_g1_i3 [Pachycerianthus borealis]
MSRTSCCILLLIFSLKTLASPVFNANEPETAAEIFAPEFDTDSFSNQVEEAINELDAYELKKRLANLQDEDHSYQDTEEFQQILRQYLDEHKQQEGNTFDRILAVNRAHGIARELHASRKKDHVGQPQAGNVEDELIQINYKENDLGLYQGDVKLDPDEEELVEEGYHLRRKKRNAVGSKKRLWMERIVRFYIDSSAAYASKVIREAANTYNSKTCVKWVEISPRQAARVNHVVFKKDAGCWSRIGRLYWKKEAQTISVGDGCDHVGTMLHEMMHAIGFWHEQARSDRDDYVSIQWENIIPGKADQFDKLSAAEVDVLGLQYDYKSLMHYSKTSFTANGKETVASILKPDEKTFGSEMFTQLDLQKINVLYHCSTGVNAGWSPWGGWSSCEPKSCKRTRERICLSPEYRQERDCPGAKNYYGVERITEKCPTKCPYAVPGMWNKWSSWTDCSVSCGEGTRKRERKCDEPAPKNNGEDCKGSSIEKGTCYKGRCSKGAYDNEFETGWKGWNSVSSYKYVNWQLKSGPTKFWGTGPGADHTTGKGWYALMETSWGQKGQKAQLWTSTHPPTKYSCLTFWYHMYGKNIGRLWVYVEPVGKAKWIKWQKAGDQGDRWINAAVTIEMPDYYYKIMFEGQIGDKFNAGMADIGIDDVYLDPGKCPELCEDSSNQPCEKWAKGGECHKNAAFMKKSCCKSCKKYKDVPVEEKSTTCKDKSTSCSSWAKKGECEKNPTYMLGSCCASCKGLSCVDESVECQRWAQQGECSKNPEYMGASCRLSCKKC